MSHGPHKFDRARAGKFDDPARQVFLPNECVIELLRLSGDETVVVYGADSGVLTVEVVRALVNGEIYAVEESLRMVLLLQGRLRVSERATPGHCPYGIIMCPYQMR